MFLKVLISSIFLASFQQTLANESAEKPPDKKEAKGNDLPPWVELQYKIQFLQGKIGVAEGNLVKLLEEKKKLPNDAPGMKALITELVKTHKDLEKMQQEYDQLNGQLIYRFPERASKENRYYKPTEVKSLNEMEEDVGIDSKLNRSMYILRHQYGAESKPERAPASTEKKIEKSVIEAPSIILSR